MKQLKLKEGVQNILGGILFYLIIILGVVLVNYRMGEINDQKNTSQQEVELVTLDNAS